MDFTYIEIIYQCFFPDIFYNLLIVPGKFCFLFIFSKNLYPNIFFVLYDLRYIRDVYSKTAFFHDWSISIYLYHIRSFFSNNIACYRFSI